MINKKQPTSLQPEFQGAYWERIKEQVQQESNALGAQRYDQ